MNTIETVITRTRNIEGLLSDMGAEGSGLHEKTSSVKEKLKKRIIKKIRFIASVRNKLVHEDNFDLSDDLLSDFLGACDEIETSLGMESMDQSDDYKELLDEYMDLMRLSNEISKERYENINMRPVVPAIKTEFFNLFRSFEDQVLFSDEEERIKDERDDDFKHHLDKIEIRQEAIMAKLDTL